MCLYALVDNVHSAGVTAHLSFGIADVPAKVNNVLVGPHRWVRDSLDGYTSPRRWEFDGEIEEVDRETIFEHFFGPASERTMIPTDRMPNLEKVRTMWPSQLIELRKAFEVEFGLKPFEPRSACGDYIFAALVTPEEAVAA